MNFGMIGAIGGAGAGLTTQGNFLATQEAADLDDTRKRNLATFTANLNQEMAQRQDQYTWNQTVARAPQTAQMAADADVTKKGAELKFATDNQGAIASNAASEAEAKETKATKTDKAAEAEYKKAYAGYLADSKGKPGTIDPALAAELHTEGESLRASRTAVEKAILDGSLTQAIDPDTKKPMVDPQTGAPVMGNPAQRQMIKDLAMREQRYLDLVRTASRPAKPGAATGPSDELGIRGTAPRVDGTTADGQPYTMKSPRSAEPTPKDGMIGGFDIYQGDGKTIDPLKLRNAYGAVDDLKDPQTRADARLALVNQQAPMGSDGGARAPAGAAPAPASKPLFANVDDGNPNFPGGRLQVNLPDIAMPHAAANVPVSDPSVYDANFGRTPAKRAAAPALLTTGADPTDPAVAGGLNDQVLQAVNARDVKTLVALNRSYQFSKLPLATRLRAIKLMQDALPN